MTHLPPSSFMSFERPMTSPIPELSMKVTPEKSSTSSSTAFIRAARSISERIAAAVWWSISPASRAVSREPFISVDTAIVLSPDHC